jgi:hypothetical protein
VAVTAHGYYVAKEDRCFGDSVVAPSLLRSLYVAHGWRSPIGRHATGFCGLACWISDDDVITDDSIDRRAFGRWRVLTVEWAADRELFVPVAIDLDVATIAAAIAEWNTNAAALVDRAREVARDVQRGEVRS